MEDYCTRPRSAPTYPLHNITCAMMHFNTEHNAPHTMPSDFFGNISWPFTKLPYFKTLAGLFDLVIWNILVPRPSLEFLEEFGKRHTALCHSWMVGYDLYPNSTQSYHLPICLGIVGSWLDLLETIVWAKCGRRRFAKSRERSTVYTIYMKHIPKKAL